MLFNSLEFAFFLPLVFFFYWFVFKRNLRLQNIFLIVASYFFYGWWDWRFLGLILISTVVDFFVGLSLAKKNTQGKRTLLLLTSLIVNLGILGFFKYYNFFVESFIQAFSFFGYSLTVTSLKIILPVGISFYTFQTLSYTIDIYRGKLEPTKDFISFSAFVSFFPQLVAGPIERASSLLPQFFRERTFNSSSAIDGLRQILWGLFKKIVIADNCAEFANLIFNNSSEYNGSTLLLGVFFFAFQIYGDFSGYSDIAIGTAKLFGFNLMRNFAYPYFSRDIAEFWRRWHISLSSWFRDYVYIPLGGSRAGTAIMIRNIFIIFLLSGFWHGANWTFLAWGALNAIYFLPLFLLKRNRQHIEIVARGRYLPSFREFLNISITFMLTLLAWVFFRAASIGDALAYLGGIFNRSIFEKPETGSLYLVILIMIFILVEWFGREKQYAIESLEKHLPSGLRWAVYYIIIIFILFFSGNQQDFIYFQF